MLFQNKPKQRLVDVTPILQEFWKVADMCEGKNPYENIRINAYRRCFERLTYAPTIDAEPIVRCKDCKYFDGEPGQPNIQCSQMHEDDFCSYGVRKGGE